MTKEITDNDFQKEVIDSKQPVLIDFSLLIIYLSLFLFIKELTSAFDFPPLLVLLSSCCAQRTCTRSPVQHSCTVQYMFIYTLYEPGLRYNTPVQ